jgi:hypothetical protein
VLALAIRQFAHGDFHAILAKTFFVNSPIWLLANMEQGQYAAHAHLAMLRFEFLDGSKILT